MVRRLALVPALALAVLGGAISLTHEVSAHETAHNSLVIDHPYVLALPPSVPNSAAYVTVKNTGKEADRLIAIKGDAAKMFQIHSTAINDGVAQMRAIDGGVEIPAGGEISLAPGGTHIMMMGIQELLIEGTSFPLTLVFEKAGEIEVDVAVEARGSHGGDAMNHGGMNHGGMNHDSKKKAD